MIVLNIIFYIFGIIIPSVIILLSVFVYKKNIKRNTLISVIIFLLFYILKVGGYNLMFKNKVTKDNDNVAKETINTNTEENIEEGIEEENINNSNENDVKENIEDNKTNNNTTNNSSNNNTSNKNNNEVTTKPNNVSNNENSKVEYIDGVPYIDGLIIVNKTYELPKDYVPKNTYKEAGSSEYCSTCLDIDTYENFQMMKSDALALGLNLWIQSGYRSYTLQQKLYNNYVSRDGVEAADRYSARPGHSEHQTGFAFDLNTITDSFQYTDEGKWVNENAYKYGFILRYPKEKESITGYKYEPWHLRYVGKDLATILYNNGNWITLEEYYNLTSTYSN